MCCTHLQNGFTGFLCISPEASPLLLGLWRCLAGQGLQCRRAAPPLQTCSFSALPNVMGACWGQTSLKGRLSDWVDSVAEVASPSGPNPQPMVAHFWGWLLPRHPSLMSFPVLLREGCSLWEEGGRESTLAVPSHPGSASSLGWVGAGRWKMPGRGCNACWAGGHHRLSLSLCLVLVALCFASLLELFWGRLLTTLSAHTQSYYGYPLCLWKWGCALNSKGTGARETLKHS